MPLSRLDHATGRDDLPRQRSEPLADPYQCDILPRSPWLGHQMQFNGLRRREFIRLLGGAVCWPFAACAQQSSMPTVGFLNSSSSSWGEAYLVPGFRAGLGEEGYVEGKNALIDFRWGGGSIRPASGCGSRWPDKL
jgi:hypothetical protein